MYNCDLLCFSWRGGSALSSSASCLSHFTVYSKFLTFFSV